MTVLCYRVKLSWTNHHSILEKASEMEDSVDISKYDIIPRCSELCRESKSPTIPSCFLDMRTYQLTYCHYLMETFIRRSRPSILQFTNLKGKGTASTYPNIYFYGKVNFQSEECIAPKTVTRYSTFWRFYNVKFQLEEVAGGVTNDHLKSGSLVFLVDDTGLIISATVAGIK